jgi:hypothetical protein
MCLRNGLAISNLHEKNKGAIRTNCSKLTIELKKPVKSGQLKIDQTVKKE